MSILIVGGTGFIGARIAKKLVDRGEEVVCFDLYPNYSRVEGLSDKAKVVVGDVTHIEDILSAIKDFNVKRIISLAAVLVTESETFLIKALRLNFMGMVNVFEAAKLTGIKRVVYASSVAAYGLQSSFGDREISEEDVCQPTLAYGAHKLWAEFMAKKYEEHHDLSTVGLRIAIVSGPGRKVGISAWSSTYIDNSVVGKPVHIPYRSNQKIMITYVDETAETFVRFCLADDLKHTVYNSLAYSLTIKELADVVKNFIPDAKITFDESAKDVPLVYNWSSKRLTEDFGLENPPIEEMVKKHINEVRENEGLQKN